MRKNSQSELVTAVMIKGRKGTFMTFLLALTCRVKKALSPTRQQTKNTIARVSA